jgi:hypothetical protein
MGGGSFVDEPAGSLESGRLETWNCYQTRGHRYIDEERERGEEGAVAACSVMRSNLPDA